MNTLVLLSSLVFASPNLAEDSFKKEFVGCYPSSSECRYSCPTERYFAEKNEELCSNETGYQPIACYCLTEEEK